MNIIERIKIYLKEETPIFDNFLKVKLSKGYSHDYIQIFYNNNYVGKAEIEKDDGKKEYYIYNFRRDDALKGMGEKVLKYILKRYKGMLYLHVSSNNNVAIKLYEKMGFRRDNSGKISNIFKFSNSDVNILYSKDNT